MMDGEDQRDVSERLTQQIDENLKRVYQEIVGDDVPDKFMQLLSRLRDEGPEVAEPATDDDAVVPMPTMAGSRR